MPMHDDGDNDHDCDNNDDGDNDDDSDDDSDDDGNMEMVGMCVDIRVGRDVWKM